MSTKSTEGGDDTPPAWMSEDPLALNDLSEDSYPWLDDEPLLTDDDITPELLAPMIDAGVNAAHIPHFVADPIETLEIFYPEKLSVFAKAKKAAQDLRAVAESK